MNPSIPGSSLRVRRLGVEDVEAFRELRLMALNEAPDAFGSVYLQEREWPLSVFRQRLDESFVHGAYFDAAGLVGIAGLRPEPGLTERHKGTLWGVYVRNSHRHAGVADALLQAAMAAARGQALEQLLLTVVEGNAVARRLFERHGFTVYGIEPRSLRRGDGYRDEALMVRFLDRK